MDRSKIKHKLSKSFIFSSPNSQHRHSSTPSDQSRSTSSKKQKDQILNEILGLVHSKEQTQMTSEINHLSDEMFQHKYRTNPFFKEKVKIIYKKNKRKERNSFNVSWEREEDPTINDISGFLIKEFIVVKDQLTSKERQEQEIIQKYERLILKNL